ncbi:hypothetical protein RFI_29567, partial [Reticulomyxa filosa]
KILRSFNEDNVPSLLDYNDKVDLAANNAPTRSAAFLNNHGLNQKEHSTIIKTNKKKEKINKAYQKPTQSTTASEKKKQINLKDCTENKFGYSRKKKNSTSSLILTFLKEIAVGSVKILRHLLSLKEILKVK